MLETFRLPLQGSWAADGNSSCVVTSPSPRSGLPAMLGGLTNVEAVRIRRPGPVDLNSDQTVCLDCLAQRLLATERRSQFAGASTPREPRGRARSTGGHSRSSPLRPLHDQQD